MAPKHVNYKSLCQYIFIVYKTFAAGIKTKLLPRTIRCPPVQDNHFPLVPRRSPRYTGWNLILTNT